MVRSKNAVSAKAVSRPNVMHIVLTQIHSKK